ncbi:MAG: rRNA maturation RNase YbeY [Porticoccaceae bacterium]|nr:rRNA maturation RNase YbeY [Porticoccaceae bacterium]
MTITVDIDNAAGSDDVPDESSLHCWVTAVLQPNHPDSELAIRIVSEAESAALNRQYRQKQGATNVLSFPAELPEEIDLPLLGDLAICAPVVAREAREQGKTLEAHWAHMVVHGTLHLLGYDHLNDTDAEVMEALETRILSGLGFPPPYEWTDNSEKRDTSP